MSVAASRRTSPRDGRQLAGTAGSVDCSASRHIHRRARGYGFDRRNAPELVVLPRSLLATACAAPKLIHQRRVLRQLRAEAPAHGVAKIEHRWIGDRVVDVGPVLPPGNESCVLEDAQMLGDVRLCRSDVCDELADVSFPRPQGLEDLNADRLAEDAKACRHELHGVG